jgi:hypothetical protein
MGSYHPHLRRKFRRCSPQPSPFPEDAAERLRKAAQECRSRAEFSPLLRRAAENAAGVIAARAKKAPTRLAAGKSEIEAPPGQRGARPPSTNLSKLRLEIR